MESNKNPDCNVKLMSQLSHNWRSSMVDMNLNYGTDFKNKEKQISFSTSMIRNIKSWSFASLNLNSKLEIGTVSNQTDIVSNVIDGQLYCLI